jgi:hypothetical protein
MHAWHLPDFFLFCLRSFGYHRFWCLPPPCVTEYLFKLALANKQYVKVMQYIRSSRLCGQVGVQAVRVFVWLFLSLFPTTFEPLPFTSPPV